MTMVWKSQSHLWRGEFCMVSGHDAHKSGSLSSLGKEPHRLVGGRAAWSQSLMQPPCRLARQAHHRPHSWSLVSSTVASVWQGSQRRTSRGCLKGGEKVHPRTRRSC